MKIMKERRTTRKRKIMKWEKINRKEKNKKLFSRKVIKRGAK